MLEEKLIEQRKKNYLKNEMQLQQFKSKKKTD